MFTCYLITIKNHKPTKNCQVSNIKIGGHRPLNFLKLYIDDLPKLLSLVLSLQVMLK